MIFALLGTVAVVSAGACGLAVYRTRETRPVVRALVTFGCLLVTPVAAFTLFSATMTSGLPVGVAILPIVLGGVGLYVVAEGTAPRFRPGRTPDR